jgi:hypothetical protein
VDSIALYPFAFFPSIAAPGGSKFFEAIYRYAGAMNELPIIQKTHDLIQWYVPVLNRLPRDHKFMLGDRIITGLYDLLEGLIQACYANERVST